MVTVEDINRNLREWQQANEIGVSPNKDKQTGHAWCPRCSQRVNGYFSESSDMSHFWLVEFKYCPNCGCRINWNEQSAL